MPWWVAAVPVLVLAAIVAGFAWFLGGFPMASGVLLASGLLSLFGGVLCCFAAGQATAGVLEFLRGRSRWTRVLSAFAAGWGILCGVVPLWECVRGPGRGPATWGVLSAAVLGAIFGAASQKLARKYVRRTGAVTYQVTTADVS
ncbi:MAG: hypothetical protein D6725_04355 [Planctomycetota bacterium]|nr:MAG: hypothetical protein D6725_04355 [Planctomycetota bacterium]